VKFTPSGGRVDVSVWRRDGHVEIRVADTGQGIATELLPQIFAPFHQGVTTGARRSSEGLGLGLSIVKEMVELHGGTISVTSPGADRGTTVTVLLPLPNVETSRLFVAARSGASKSQDSGKPKLSGIRILFVEDDQANRHATTALLRRAGAEVLAVASAAEAIEAFRKQTPDIIVSDIGMADMDGYSMMAAIQAIEAEDNSQPVPAIALTAFSSKREQAKALNSGFQHHIAKPPEPADLFDAIRRLCRYRNSVPRV
jgi:CheY-like chemotaxis protein